MRRRLIVCSTAALLALAACSSSGSHTSNTVSGPTTTARPGTPAAVANDGGTIATLPLGPTTTFMHDCSPMPSTSLLVKLSTTPLAEGRVSAGGTCTYLGLNDQSKSVTLAFLTVPADVAAFHDVQTGLGKAVASKAVKGAFVSGGSVVWLKTAKGTYTVEAHVANTPAKNLVIAELILARWIAG